MKRITDLLKPNILIIFGALLFLVYLNWLSYGGEGLALGIIAVVFSVYYLGIGILSIIIGDKFSPLLRKIFDLISASLFPIFMFVYFLIMTIDLANYMGPTAWIIAILSMIASLAVVAFYIVSKFVNKGIIIKLAYLFAAIFALALLLNVLFDANGGTAVLGNISIIEVVIYGLFIFFLFNALGKAEEAPKEEAAPVEEKQEEEPAPEEEAPAE